VVDINELVVGEAYYMAGFADPRGQVHTFDTVIFMGFDLIGPDTDVRRVYFKFSEDYFESSDIDGAFWFGQSDLFTIYDLKGLHDYIGKLVT